MIFLLLRMSSNSTVPVVNGDDRYVVRSRRRMTIQSARVFVVNDAPRSV
jgi:hypothetical protein